MTSAQEEVKGEGGTSPYVQTSRLKSYRSDTNRLEEGAGGGVGSPSVWVSAAQRKWGGGTGETKAASGGPLGTKPFLRARQADWESDYV